MIDVLWLEDQADCLRDFYDFADDSGVRLITKKTAEEAKTFINDASQHLDAAILDARGFQHSPSEQKGTRGMHVIKDLLIQKKIPFAIFSGETSIVANEEFRSAIPDDVAIFEKGKDEDKVIEHVKRIVKDSPNVRIKREYALAFSIFSNPKLQDLFDEDFILKNQNLLIKLLKNKEDNRILASCIRDLYESLIFDIFERYGVFNKEIDEYGNFSFNKTALKLENRESRYRGREYIGKMACMVALYSQALNHSRDTTSVGKYLNRSGNTYYCMCLLNGILTVMSWLNDFLDNQSSI
jgi:hypothetical protein